MEGGVIMPSNLPQLMRNVQPQGASGGRPDLKKLEQKYIQKGWMQPGEKIEDYLYNEDYVPKTAPGEFSLQPEAPSAPNYSEAPSEMPPLTLEKVAKMEEAYRKQGLMKEGESLWDAMGYSKPPDWYTKQQAEAAGKPPIMMGHPAMEKKTSFAAPGPGQKRAGMTPADREAEFEDWNNQMY